MRNDASTTLLPRCLVLAAVVYCAVALLYRPTTFLAPVSSGDDASYISHAFTIALDFDLDYQNEPVFIPGQVHLIAPSGRVPSHPVGPGLMAAPFVAVFSILDRVTDNPVIRDHTNYVTSWSIFGFFIAAASWFFLGAWLYMKAFEAIGAKTSRWAILLFASAIGLPYYILLRPTMGHAFEFASAAMVFWGAVQVMVPGRRGRAVPEVAIVIGILLTVLARPADVNILLLPIVVWGLLLLTRRGAWPTLTWRGDGTVLAIASVCALSVFAGINEALYGTAMPGLGDTYGGNPFFVNAHAGPLGLLWLGLRSLPLLWPLLTTSEFGLLWSAPILPAGALALLAILVTTWKHKKLAAVVTLLAASVYMAVPLAIVLILKSTGELYGYRYLFGLLPICLLGAVLFLEDAAFARISRFARPLLVVLSLWALLGGMFIDTGSTLSSRHTANVYGRTDTFSYVGYETALVKAVVTPRSWIDVVARRLPGFVAVRFAPNVARLGAPSKTQDAINRIKQLRSSYFCAIVVFWFLYPLFLAHLCDGVLRGCIVDGLRKIARPVKTGI